jgi:hypothetical protein
VHAHAHADYIYIYIYIYVYKVFLTLNPIYMYMKTITISLSLGSITRVGMCNRQLLCNQDLGRLLELAASCDAVPQQRGTLWFQPVILLLRVLLWLLCTGYEAETVAAADRSLKDAIGPLAYVVAGAADEEAGCCAWLLGLKLAVRGIALLEHQGGSHRAVGQH